MPTAPYPTLEECVNAARVKLNDAIFPGGQTLTDTQSFTIDVINLAYQQCQQFLVSQGYETLEDELVLSALAGVTTIDPAIQASLSWFGYNNGGGLSTAKVLPQSLIRALDLWERPSGSMGVFVPMDEILGGLPMVPKQQWNQMWEWRSDTIYMPGALANTDIRVRFAKYLADFVPNSTTAFSAQTVPIMRSKDALSGFIAHVMCGGRGDTDAAAILGDAQQAAMIIVSLDSMEGRSVPKESERGKMKDRYTGGGAQS